jgi:trigger factor
MPIISSKFVTPIRYEVVFNISKEDYTKWYDRLLDQLLSRVEVPGYRPGKAPKDKLLASVDADRVTQIIFQETVDKYAPEAVEEANTKIQENNADHVVLNHNVDQDSAKLSDDGFSFTLISTLLPLIDLEPLEKLKVKAPADKELNLPSKEEFHTQEIGKFLYYFNVYSETAESSKAGSKMIVNLEGKVDGLIRSDLGGPNQEVVLGFGRYLPDFEKGLLGLKKGDKTKFKVTFPADYFVADVQNKTADFEAEITDLKQGAYLTIEELVEKNENVSFKSLVPDMATLEKDIADAYEKNKETLRNNKLRANVIKELISVVPEFTLPQEDVDKEFDRIKTNVEKLAEENKLSKAEVIKTNGIPFDKEPKTDKEIEKTILDYVQKEFKLSLTLNFIYLRRIPSIERATQEQVEEIAAAMIKDPAQYNLPVGITKEAAEREANDRLVRNTALDWVMKKVVA